MHIPRGLEIDVLKLCTEGGVIQTVPMHRILVPFGKHRVVGVYAVPYHDMVEAGVHFRRGAPSLHPASPTGDQSMLLVVIARTRHKIGRCAKS